MHSNRSSAYNLCWTENFHQKRVCSVSENETINATSIAEHWLTENAGEFDTVLCPYLSCSPLKKQLYLYYLVVEKINGAATKCRKLPIRTELLCKVACTDFSIHFMSKDLSVTCWHFSHCTRLWWFVVFGVNERPCVWLTYSQSGRCLAM